MHFARLPALLKVLMYMSSLEVDKDLDYAQRSLHTWPRDTIKFCDDGPVVSLFDDC